MRRIKVSIPSRYRESNFYAVIKRIKDSTYCLEDGRIVLRCINKSFDFTRRGKKFKASVFALMNELEIKIEELNE